MTPKRSKSRSERTVAARVPGKGRTIFSENGVVSARGPEWPVNDPNQIVGKVGFLSCP